MLVLASLLMSVTEAKLKGQSQADFYQNLRNKKSDGKAKLAELARKGTLRSKIMSEKPINTETAKENEDDRNL